MLRSWKLFVILVLLGINGFLFFSFQSSRTHITQTFLSLTTSPVASYFGDELQGRSIGYVFDFSGDRKRGAKLGEASDSLRQVVVKIRRRYIEEGVGLGSMGAGAYFSKKISVDPELQKDLVNAFEKYQMEMTNLLQTEVAPRRIFRDSLAKTMLKELDKVELQCRKLSAGTIVNRTLDVALRGKESSPVAF